MAISEPTVAIVHDALVGAGGAERSVVYMCEAFPNAPLYTSVYLPERTHPEFQRYDVRPLLPNTWMSTERRAKQLFRSGRSAFGVFH